MGGNGCGVNFFKGGETHISNVRIIHDSKSPKIIKNVMSEVGYGLKFAFFG